MAGVALASAGAIAATLGTLIAPKLTPEAKQLLLALALLLQGGGVVGRVKAPDRLTGWRLGVVLTSVVGLFVLAFGDGVQFVVLALAARSAMPWLAVVGAVAGSLAVVLPAIMLGEAAWCRLPLAKARIGVSILFLVVGAWLAVSALALV